MSALRYRNAVCCFNMKAILWVFPGVQVPSAIAGSAAIKVAAPNATDVNSHASP
jgi:hypothetical protein